jgi:hypothetical protein
MLHLFKAYIWNPIFIKIFIFYSHLNYYLILISHSQDTSGGMELKYANLL